MNRYFLASLLLLAALPLRAGFTPGHYEIQSIGGVPYGELTVTSSSATFEGKPATRVIWDFKYDGQGRLTERHEAFLGKDGLIYFKQEITDEKGTFLAESQKDADKFTLFVNDHGRKYSTGVPLKGLDMSDYDLETPRSKFWGMKLGEAKNATVLSINQLAAVRTRRNINEITRMPAANKKDVDVFVVSTNFSNTVVTSWITVNTHVLLKERWIDRQFIRLEK